MTPDGLSSRPEIREDWSTRQRCWATPAETLRRVQPARVMLDIEHQGEAIGELVSLFRGESGHAWAVAVSDHDWLAEFPEPLYFSAAFRSRFDPDKSRARRRRVDDGVGDAQQGAGRDLARPALEPLRPVVLAPGRGSQAGRRACGRRAASAQQARVDPDPRRAAAGRRRLPAASPGHLRSRGGAPGGRAQALRGPRQDSQPQLTRQGCARRRRCSVRA